MTGIVFNIVLGGSWDLVSTVISTLTGVRTNYKYSYLVYNHSYYKSREPLSTSAAPASLEFRKRRAVRSWNLVFRHVASGWDTENPIALN